MGVNDGREGGAVVFENLRGEWELGMGERLLVLKR